MGNETSDEVSEGCEDRIAARAVSIDKGRSPRVVIRSPLSRLRFPTGSTHCWPLMPVSRCSNASGPREKLGPANLGAIDAVPAAFGRFRIIRELGRGGFGVVS